MPSFFLSETCKYLYLLFDENNFIHDRAYIFSTEAHPFDPVQLPTVLRSEDIESSESAASFDNYTSAASAGVRSLERVKSEADDQPVTFDPSIDLEALKEEALQRATNLLPLKCRKRLYWDASSSFDIMYLSPLQIITLPEDGGSTFVSGSGTEALSPPVEGGGWIKNLAGGRGAGDMAQLAVMAMASAAAASDATHVASVAFAAASANANAAAASLGGRVLGDKSAAALLEAIEEAEAAVMNAKLEVGDWLAARTVATLGFAAIAAQQLHQQVNTFHSFSLSGLSVEGTNNSMIGGKKQVEMGKHDKISPSSLEGRENGWVGLASRAWLSSSLLHDDGDYSDRSMIGGGSGGAKSVVGVDGGISHVGVGGLGTRFPSNGLPDTCYPGEEPLPHEHQDAIQTVDVNMGLLGEFTVHVYADGFVVYSKQWGDTVEISNVGQSVMFVRDHNVSSAKTVIGDGSGQVISCSVSIPKPFSSASTSPPSQSPSATPPSRGESESVWERSCSVAAFGPPSGWLKPVTAELILPVPPIEPSLCAAPAPPPPPSHPIRRWWLWSLQASAVKKPISARPFNNRIVLAQRGECMFEEKAISAQEGGALALIVSNSEDALFIMSGKKQEQSAKDVGAALATAFASVNPGVGIGAGAEVAPPTAIAPVPTSKADAPQPAIPPNNCPSVGVAVAVPGVAVPGMPGAVIATSAATAAALVAALTKAAAIAGNKVTGSEQEVANVLAAAIDDMRKSGLFYIYIFALIFS